MEADNCYKKQCQNYNGLFVRLKKKKKGTEKERKNRLTLKLEFYSALTSDYFVSIIMAGA